MAIEKEIIIKVDTDDAQQELEALTDSVDDVSESVKKVEDGTDKTTSATKKLSKGFKAVGTAMKAAGIGLVIALFAKLFEVVNKNQKVIDFFSTTMTVLEMVFKDLYDFVSSNFMPTFQKVKEFFQNFTFQNIINGAKNVLKWFGKLASAGFELMKGNLKEAKKLANEAFAPIVDVVKRTTDAIVEGAKSIKDYTKETVNAAKAVTELNNQALIAESINRGLIEQYDRQAEQLRQLRDDETALIEDRIAANEKLGEVLNEQEKLMLQNADLMVQAAQNQLAINNNIENQIALQDALNERAGIQAQIEGFRSEQLINQNSLLKERNELEGEYFDEIDRMMNEDLKEYDDQQKQRFEWEQERNKESLSDAEATEGAKLAIAGQTSNLIGQIVNEDSKAAKGVAVASAVISGYESVQNAFTTAQKSPITALNPAYPFIQAGLAGAFSLLQLNKIKSSDPTGATGGGGGTSTGGNAPSFNLVQGTGTNQIAEGLIKEEAPVKAYVVSGDVTTSQELDRKIVEGASL